VPGWLGSTVLPGADDLRIRAPTGGLDPDAIPGIDDCVGGGGGIRKPESLLELFEAVINPIRLNAPDAAIAFNTDGGTSLEAARRVLAPCS
jgi:hypothetical protein